jgi:hypothetical protein
MGLQLSPSLSNLIAIAGILGALLLILDASNREASAYGPGAITATLDGHVYFVAGDDRLYRAGRDGELLQSASFGETGTKAPLPSTRCWTETC